MRSANPNDSCNRLLGEFRDRAGLYTRQSPEVLETLRRAAILRSVESSNRIEGVTIAAGRIDPLVLRRATPRDRFEQEVAGYRDSLARIHADGSRMKLSLPLIRGFHRDMYRYTEEKGGQWKARDNAILETRADGKWSAPQHGVHRDYNARQCDYLTNDPREPDMGQPLVSIRDLKSRLSHYLRLARNGESVVITDRGVPIGRIVPVGQDLDQRLAAMRESGQAQWSGRKLRTRTPVARVRGRGSVARLLVEDRG